MCVCVEPILVCRKVASFSIYNIVKTYFISWKIKTPFAPEKVLFKLVKDMYFYFWLDVKYLLLFEWTLKIYCICCYSSLNLHTILTNSHGTSNIKLGIPTPRTHYCYEFSTMLQWGFNQSWESLLCYCYLCYISLIYIETKMLQSCSNLSKWSWGFNHSWFKFSDLDM